MSANHRARFEGPTNPPTNPLTHSRDIEDPSALCAVGLEKEVIQGWSLTFFISFFNKMKLNYHLNLVPYLPKMSLNVFELLELCSFLTYSYYQ